MSNKTIDILLLGFLRTAHRMLLESRINWLISNYHDNEDKKIIAYNDYIYFVNYFNLVDYNILGNTGNSFLKKKLFKIDKNLINEYEFNKIHSFVFREHDSILDYRIIYIKNMSKITLDDYNNSISKYNNLEKIIINSKLWIFKEDCLKIKEISTPKESSITKKSSILKEISNLKKCPQNQLCRKGDLCKLYHDLHDSEIKPQSMKIVQKNIISEYSKKGISKLDKIFLPNSVI